MPARIPAHPARAEPAGPRDPAQVARLVLGVAAVVLPHKVLDPTLMMPPPGPRPHHLRISMGAASGRNNAFRPWPSSSRYRSREGAAAHRGLNQLRGNTPPRGPQENQTARLLYASIMRCDATALAAAGGFG